MPNGLKSLLDSVWLQTHSCVELMQACSLQGVHSIVRLYNNAKRWYIIHILFCFTVWHRFVKHLQKGLTIFDSHLHFVSSQHHICTRVIRARAIISYWGNYCRKSVTSLKARHSIGQMRMFVDRNMHKPEVVSASWWLCPAVWASNVTQSEIIWFEHPIALLWIIFKARVRTGWWGTEKLPLINIVTLMISKVMGSPRFDLWTLVQLGTVTCATAEYGTDASKEQAFTEEQRSTKV